VLLRLLVRARRVETVVVVADRLAGREALPDEKRLANARGTQKSADVFVGSQGAKEHALI